MLELFAASPMLFVTVVVLVAMLIGSFLNVVIYRLPVMMQRDWRAQAESIIAEEPAALPEGRFDLIMPRSRCPSCGNQIAAIHNIPIFSWLALRGKCGSCAASISFRYPAVEALTAILAGLVAWRFGFSVEAVAAVILTCVLIAITFIDFDHQLIPDSLSVPLIWLGLFLSLFHPFSTTGVLFVPPEDAIVGALAGYLTLWSVNALFRQVRGREGMGYGDFKLLAALGAWLGYQMLPLIVLMSAAVGTVVGLSMIVFMQHDKRIPIPFGPYLAAAGWVTLMWGNSILDWYLDLFIGTT